MSAIAETFIFGLANSLHCAGMCGPLAGCTPGGRLGAGMYHVARIGAYAGMGAVAGSLGFAATGNALSGAPWIPFVLGGSLMLFALGVHAKGPQIPGLTNLLHRVVASTGRAPLARATVMGAITPLLPCGLLVALYGSALLADGWREGAAVTFGFALGSTPVLVAAQAQLALIRRTMAPQTRLRVYRLVMAAAAGVLLWRGWMEMHGTSCCT